MGFASRSLDVFVPFISIVLPGVFVLGVFTVIRLVDTALENMRYLAGIARIRGYYRTLSPEAAVYFAARHGRWPEGQSDPALGLGFLMGVLLATALVVAFLAYERWRFRTLEQTEQTGKKDDRIDGRSRLSTTARRS
jgi:hypothetical protein